MRNAFLFLFYRKLLKLSNFKNKIENQELQWYNYFNMIHQRKVLLVYLAISHK